MSRIARCGKCQARVTVPEGLEEGESVRCPICQAVYPLTELPAEAVDADNSEMPPELAPVAEVSEPGQAPESLRGEPEARERQEGQAVEANGQPEPPPEADSGEGLDTADEEEDTTEGPSDPIDEGTDEAIEAPAVEADIEPGQEDGASAPTETDSEKVEGSEGEEEGAREEAVSDEQDQERAAEEGVSDEHATAAGEEPAEAAAAEETVQVRCPHCQAEYPLSQVVVVTTGAELGPAMAAAVARYVLPGEGPAGEAPALDVWAKTDAVPQIDLGDSARPQAVSDHASAFDFARGAADAEAGPTGAAPLRPRRRKQKSMVQKLVGPVFGGVAGLLIAAYILAIIGRPLKIPLPFISATYQYSPDWFPGWMKAAPESEEEEEASEEIADLSDVFGPAFQDDAGGSEQPAFALPKTEPASAPVAETPEPDLADVEPPPQPKAHPDGYVGLASPPSYTADELGEALKAVHESVGEKGKPISEDAYGKWCRLAEVVTFVHGGPGVGQLRDRKAAVGTLLVRMGRNETNLDKIGFQAGARCMAGNRPSNGILLAGKVTGITSEGSAHGAHVELAASGQTILVAGNRPLPAQEGESVLILGRIVDDPAKHLIGFKTQQPLVVWAGLTVKIEP